MIAPLNVAVSFSRFRAANWGEGARAPLRRARGASTPRLASCDLGERAPGAEGAEGITRFQPSERILQSLIPIF